MTYYIILLIALTWLLFGVWVAVTCPARKRGSKRKEDGDE